MGAGEGGVYTGKDKKRASPLVYTPGQSGQKQSEDKFILQACTSPLLGWGGSLPFRNGAMAPTDSVTEQMFSLLYI